MTLGITDGTKNYGFNSNSNTANPYPIINTSNYGKSVGDTSTPTGFISGGYKALGITPDPTKSGIETSDQDLYLYFYVGETAKNASLVNVAALQETVNTLVSDNSVTISGYAMPSDKHIDLTLLASGSTYTAPANGYFYYYVTSKGINQGCYFELPNGLGVIGINSGNYPYIFTMYSPLIPVRKGDSIKIFSKNTSESYEGMKFIYAEGSKVEAE